jgi:hypothetical protein
MIQKFHFNGKMMINRGGFLGVLPTSNKAMPNDPTFWVLGEMRNGPQLGQ